MAVSDFFRVRLSSDRVSLCTSLPSPTWSRLLSLMAALYDEMHVVYISSYRLPSTNSLSANFFCTLGFVAKNDATHFERRGLNFFRSFIHFFFLWLTLEIYFKRFLKKLCLNHKHDLFIIIYITRKNRLSNRIEYNNFIGVLLLTALVYKISKLVVM